ncbi:response regulator [Duganella lactea]|uniref:response regulator n=1 Tax=Duganella lactea TaxID=2692173 RepID=UPI0035315631
MGQYWVGANNLSLAGSSSLDAIRKLKQAAPDMQILVVSHHDERVYAERAVRAGARGYVMKTIAAKLIGRAIQTVRDGKVWLSESLKDELVNRIADGDAVRAGDELRALSDREMSVFRLIGQGLKKGGIARTCKKFCVCGAGF